MQAATNLTYNRITFSLPRTVNAALDQLKREMNRSKSEIINVAIADYLAQQEKLKLQRAVEQMAHEYETNEELTAFTALDGEDFL